MNRLERRRQVSALKRFSKKSGKAIDNKFAKQLLCTISAIDEISNHGEKEFTDDELVQLLTKPNYTIVS